MKISKSSKNFLTSNSILLLVYFPALLFIAAIALGTYFFPGKYKASMAHSPETLIQLLEYAERNQDAFLITQLLSKTSQDSIMPLAQFFQTQSIHTEIFNAEKKFDILEILRQKSKSKATSPSVNNTEDTKDTIEEANNRKLVDLIGIYLKTPHNRLRMFRSCKYQIYASDKIQDRLFYYCKPYNPVLLRKNSQGIWKLELLDL